MDHTSGIISAHVDGWTDVDVILPAQWQAGVRALPDPERRLRLAVLEGAIRDLQRYGDTIGGRKGSRYAEVADWFASADRSEPFAFENLCDALGLDPEYIRKGLDRWQAGRRDRLGPPSLPRFLSRRASGSVLAARRDATARWWPGP